MHLSIGGVDTVELAEKFGTPLYVLDEEIIRKNFRAYRNAFPDADIYYAVKANGSLAVLRILAQEGAGADVFSSGELHLALKAGIPKRKILFNGVSKSDSELEEAAEKRIKVSVDSIDELTTLAGMTKDIEIAFRVNPNISVRTNPKIATGLRTSKFGIPYQDVIKAYKKARKLGMKARGIHCHIGSQILDVEVFSEATERMMELVEKIIEFVDIEWVDLGGGLGISYGNEKAPSPEDLANAILPIFKERCTELGISPKLILEPGRSIVGNSAILLSRVNMVKKSYKNFVGIDAGFNLLIRPVLYDAYHEVVVANKLDKKRRKKYTIVGPICESGDILARDRLLPKVEKGDLIAILKVGAYGYAMSSQYNGRPRCAEVLVCNGKAELIRKEESIRDLLRGQWIPQRLR
jgi:diaminopimelate decarboxylase